MPLVLNIYDVLSVVVPDAAPITGEHRVIGFSRDGQGVWLIPVAVGHWTEYTPGPKRYSIAEVTSWLANHSVAVQPLSPPGLWLMSDDRIRAELRQEAPARCPALDKRDQDYDLIRGLVENRDTADILDQGLVFGWVKRRAAECHVSMTRLYRSLHRYWAGACNTNALLPEYPQRGKSSERRTQNTKLGRPNAKVKAGHTDLAGFTLDDDAIEKLQTGWHHFKKRGTSVPTAYLETMAAFWRADKTIVDGLPRAILLPDHQRPTEAQFRRWGPIAEDNDPAWMTQLGINEYERNHRPLPGSSRDGIIAVGQCASMDAVSGDVELVSVASRFKPVGIATRIMVRDSHLGYIAGFYSGFDAPSAATALQAIARAAENKVEFCARYGVTITNDEWPALAFKRYLADNGELRNNLSMLSVPGWGATIEYAESGRADRKPVESDHRSAQARVDHQMPGTTHGRARKRGEPEPIKNATLNHYEYVRHHIRRALYINNKMRVPHLLTLEMIKDNVEPTRIAILHWMLRNGYATQYQPDPALLRARLLPEYRAVIKGNGLFLYRPDRGDKNELIRGARFVGDYLLRSGLMERGRAKAIPVSVHVDPNDFSRVWYSTRDGLMELRNVEADALLIERATLKDVLHIQDDIHLRERLRSSETDQEALDFVIARNEDVQNAKTDKKKEAMEAGGEPSLAGRKRERRKNRAEEKPRLAALEKAAASASVAGASATTTRVASATHKQQPPANPNEQSAAPSETSTGARKKWAVQTLLDAALAAAEMEEA